MKVQRYTWTDLLVKAQAVGMISNGALLACMKLSAAINWTPSDGRVPGLYWKNDTAFEVYGLGRSTFYKADKKVLFELGFLGHDARKNLIPLLPSESLSETINDLHEQKKVKVMEKSLSETKKVSKGDSNSLEVRLEKSQLEHPFSVDNSVEILSEDVLADSHIETESPIVSNIPANAGSIPSASFKYSDILGNMNIVLSKLDTFTSSANKSVPLSLPSLHEDEGKSLSETITEEDRRTYAHQWRYDFDRKLTKLDEDEYILAKKQGKSTRLYSW